MPAKSNESGNLAAGEDVPEAPKTAGESSARTIPSQGREARETRMAAIKRDSETFSILQAVLPAWPRSAFGSGKCLELPIYVTVAWRPLEPPWRGRSAYATLRP